MVWWWLVMHQVFQIAFWKTAIDKIGLCCISNCRFAKRNWGLIKTNLIVIWWQFEMRACKGSVGWLQVRSRCCQFFSVDSRWLFALTYPNMGCFVLRPKLSPKIPLSLIVFTFLTEDVPLEVPANAHFTAKDARQGDDHDGGHHQQDPHPHHRHHCHRDFTFSVCSISHGTCHKQLTQTSE